jgi:transposase
VPAEDAASDEVALDDQSTCTGGIEPAPPAPGRAPRTRLTPAQRTQREHRQRRLQRIKRRAIALQRLAGRREGRRGSLRHVAHSLGIAPQTLSDWVRAEKAHRLETTPRGRRPYQLTAEDHDLIEELLDETRGAASPRRAGPSSGRRTSSFA